MEIVLILYGLLVMASFTVVGLGVLYGTDLRVKEGLVMLAFLLTIPPFIYLCTRLEIGVLLLLLVSISILGLAIKKRDKLFKIASKVVLTCLTALTVIVFTPFVFYLFN